MLYQPHANHSVDPDGKAGRQLIDSNYVALPCNNRETFHEYHAGLLHPQVVSLVLNQVICIPHQ